MLGSAEKIECKQLHEGLGRKRRYFRALHSTRWRRSVAGLGLRLPWREFHVASWSTALENVLIGFSIVAGDGHIFAFRSISDERRDQFAITSPPGQHGKGGVGERSPRPLTSFSVMCGACVAWLRSACRGTRRSAVTRSWWRCCACSPGWRRASRDDVIGSSAGKSSRARVREHSLASELRAPARISR